MTVRWILVLTNTNRKLRGNPVTISGTGDIQLLGIIVSWIKLFWIKDIPGTYQSNKLMFFSNMLTLNTLQDKCT